MAALRTGSSRWSPRRTIRPGDRVALCAGGPAGGGATAPALGGATGDATRSSASGATGVGDGVAGNRRAPPRIHGSKATTCRGPARTGSGGETRYIFSDPLLPFPANRNLCRSAGGKGAAVARLALSLQTHKSRVPRLLAIVREATNQRAQGPSRTDTGVLGRRCTRPTIATQYSKTWIAGPEKLNDEEITSQRCLASVLLLKLTGRQRGAKTSSKTQSKGSGKSGTTNLVTIKLFGVLGTLNTCEGSFGEAIANFQHCHRLASRAGIETIAASMAGISPCLTDGLATMTSNLEWANRAPNAGDRDFGGFVEVQIAYSKGMSYGMRGPSAGSREHDSCAETRMEKNLPGWIQQAWYLWKADLVMLMGRKSEALPQLARGIVALADCP